MTPDLDDHLLSDANLFNQCAPTYGIDPNDLEHAIPEESEELYRQDLEEVLGPLPRYQSVLEVGAGSGLLTRLLDKWGCGSITGTDISEGMLKLARAQLPHCSFRLVASEVDPSLFPPSSFDLIISRQLVCHLIDPIAVFECWRSWLKPAGRVTVIDGLWTRRNWGPPADPAGALVDLRPLSCTQTWATLSYLFERANLLVEHRGFLERVNGFAKKRYTIGEPREPVFRYLVVAMLQLST